MIHPKVYVIYENGNLMPSNFGRPGIYFKKASAEKKLQELKNPKKPTPWRKSEFEIKEYQLI